MKTLGWVVAIGIVLYLIGRSKTAKPADQKSAEVNLQLIISLRKLLPWQTLPGTWCISSPMSL